MTREPSDIRVTRRRFVVGAAALIGSAALVPLLQACSAPAPATPTSGAAAPTAAAAAPTAAAAAPTAAAAATKAPAAATTAPAATTGAAATQGPATIPTTTGAATPSS